MVLAGEESSLANAGHDGILSGEGVGSGHADDV